MEFEMETDAALTNDVPSGALRDDEAGQFIARIEEAVEAVANGESVGRNLRIVLDDPDTGRDVEMKFSIHRKEAKKPAVKTDPSTGLVIDQ